MLVSLLKQIYSNSLSRSPDESVPAAHDVLACDRWQDELVARMFKMMHTFEQDNFDAGGQSSQFRSIIGPRIFLYTPLDRFA
jgi:hypothetical protein